MYISFFDWIRIVCVCVFETLRISTYMRIYIYIYISILCSKMAYSYGTRLIHMGLIHMGGHAAIIWDMILLCWTRRTHMEHDRSKTWKPCAWCTQAPNTTRSYGTRLFHMGHAIFFHMGHGSFVEVTRSFGTWQVYDMKNKCVAYAGTVGSVKLAVCEWGRFVFRLFFPAFLFFSYSFFGSCFSLQFSETDIFLRSTPWSVLRILFLVCSSNWPFAIGTDFFPPLFFFSALLFFPRPFVVGYSCCLPPPVANLAFAQSYVSFAH